jgi:pyruvate/2-oxoglutarate dehydrogenase complex dihydrolipoamide acyltransferase (E2) component
MAIVPLKIPQIGEGLQEARLVAVLKKPGDHIKRDDLIYQMETDKAVMDVESPYEGVLVEWVAEVDTILPIGADVARMEVAGEVTIPAGHHGTPAPAVTQNQPASDEKLVSLRIPQIGEGLQEARLVAVLKQPGDAVKRDDLIYQMETDKAVMDVESPYEGILEGWTAEVDTVLAIGAEVGRMRVSGPVTEMTVHGAPAAAATVAPVAAAAASSGEGAMTATITLLRNAHISPRARAFARARGVSDNDLRSLVARHGKVMSRHLEEFLTGSNGATSKSVAATRSTGPVGGNFSEQPLGQKQRLLASRLVRGTQLVVPGTIMVACLWEQVEALRASYKAIGGDFQPSSFTMFAYAVAKATASHPGFRSTLRGDETLRTYDHLNLGIAVALPGDELVLAVVESADALSWRQFAANARERIDVARKGQDQANESVTLSLTNMQAFGLRDAVPVVVPPSVGTLFLGEPYNGLDPEADTIKMRRYVNLSLTFDHRLINGVGASEFINTVQRNVENIGAILGS